MRLVESYVWSYFYLSEVLEHPEEGISFFFSGLDFQKVDPIVELHWGDQDKLQAWGLLIGSYLIKSRTQNILKMRYKNLNKTLGLEKM